ncbi:venom allergen 5-like [Prorops nasuta]|uniref:venom allergen 5-like n=1 Tax=Prorops nasuta TaxID=863751 RepID=UPI0034D01A1E
MDFKTLKISITFIALVFISELNTKDYCGVKCIPATTHTMCKYKPNVLSQTCKAFHFRHSGLSLDEEKSILDKHNEFREFIASGKHSVQPAASDLGPLKWNFEAAEIAQTWANQCDYNNDGCRNLENNVLVGQNIGYSSSKKEQHIVNSWFNEVNNFNPKLINSFENNEGSNYTHYTQLVWANTKEIGCGFVSYDEPFEKDLTDIVTVYYLVCNYVPAGNVIGQKVYHILNK